MYEQVTRHIGVGQDYGGGGAVSNHGYSLNHDIPDHPGIDLRIIIIVTLLHTILPYMVN